MTDYTVGSVVFGPHHVLPREPVNAPMPPICPTRGPRHPDDVTSGNLPTRKKLPKGADARLMALKDGYVMARRPGCAPFVLTLKEWLALDDVET